MHDVKRRPSGSWCPRQPTVGDSLDLQPAPPSAVAAVAVDAAQKADEVVGNVVDIRLVTTRKLPLLANDFTGTGRHYQHRGHAARVRHFEIAGEVLEDRRLDRIDAVAGEEAIIDDGARLRLEFGCGNIKNVLEVLPDFEPAHHRFGMLTRAVGENEFAAGQLGDRRRQAPGWA